MQARTMQPDEVTFVDALAAEMGFALDMAAEMKRDFARIWVAREDPAEPTPDAFLLAWIAADELHLLAVGTRPERRRAGLAEHLVRTLLEYARLQRSRLVILEVRRSNRAALALYRKFGFAVSRLRRGYYAQPEEDGIEMQLVHDEDGTVVPVPDEVPWPEVIECLR
jgi:[ribosomal protein S18]-alanine N-acetyltransferase